MATVEQLAQALTEVLQQLGEAQRLAQEAQGAGVQASMQASMGSVSSAGQVDPRVMNKCPTFSGRGTEWMVVHLRVRGGHGESGTGDGERIHWVG